MKSAKSFTVVAADGVTLAITISGGDEYQNTGSGGTYTFTNKAATFYWKGSNGDWSDNANWALGSASGTAATRSPESIDTVNFNAGGTVNMGSSIFAGPTQFIFNNGTNTSEKTIFTASEGGGMRMTGSDGARIGNSTDGLGSLELASGTYYFANDVGLGWGDGNKAWGDLHVDSGATLYTRYWLHLGRGAAGSGGNLYINGGTLKTRQRYNSDIGTFENEATDDGKINLGDYANTTGRVMQASGSVTANGDIVLGANTGSVGEWTLESGSVVSMGSMEIGSGVGAYGVLTQNGGTIGVTNDFAVAKGNSSTGIVSVAGGNMVLRGNLNIGNAANATGVVEVTNATIDLWHRANWWEGGAIVPGHAVDSYGKITIGSGAKLTAHRIEMCDGGGTGEIVVMGGGELVIGTSLDSSPFYVGYYELGEANAKVEVKDSGKASSYGELRIAARADKTGVVTVSNGGEMTLYNTVYIGYGGAGTFTIEDGGHVKVQATDGSAKDIIMNTPSASGTPGDANANFDGSSSLNLNGGVLEATIIRHGTSEHATSVVNLNGGTIKPLMNGSSAPDFLQSSVTAYVKEGGLIIDTSAADGAYIGAALLHGGAAGTDGGLVKVGSGVLKLGSTGDTFNGPIVVSNGVLNINTLAVNADREIKVKIGRSNSSAIYFTTVTRSNEAKLKVSPIIDPADLPYPGMKFMVLSGLGEAFAETSQFENAATGYSVTEDHNGTPATFDLYKYTWSIESGALYVTVDYNESAIAYATWKGGVSGSLSDAANWTCTTVGGTTLDWAKPSSYTTILFTNDSASWDLPSLAGFGYLGVMVKANDIKLSADTDWSAYEVEFAEDAKVDLNNYTLTLGTYHGGNTVGGVEFTDTHEDVDSENLTYGTLVLGSGNGVMYGNEKVKFSGALKVKVTGSDATPFQATIENTHTGGWIFKDNNYAITLRYDTYGMGTGKVVFDGNGGFTSWYVPEGTTMVPEGRSKNFYEDDVRQIEVNGTGNRHVTTVNEWLHQFFRHAQFHGAGELILSGGNESEIGDNDSSWDAFTGTLVLDNVSLLLYDKDSLDNCTLKLKSGGQIRSRAQGDTSAYTGVFKKVVLDFDADNQTATFGKYNGNDPVWSIGELVEDADYTGTLNVTGRMVFPEASTASLKLGTVVAIDGEGKESDVSNLTVTIGEMPTVSTTLMTSTGTIAGAPNYSNGTWEIVPDLDSQALILQDSTTAGITAKLDGAANKSTITLEADWVTANWTGEGKPYENSRAKAIAALRNGVIADGGEVPYIWCYALGLETNASKPTFASAATASGWTLSAAGLGTVPEELQSVVKIRVEGSESADFSGDTTLGDAAAYNASVSISASDITTTSRYFRLVFDVATD